MEKLKSRKLWMAIAGLVSTLATQFLGLDPELSNSLTIAILGVVSTYILGQSYVDAKEIKLKSRQEGK